jgi:murein DD-endopeptidase
MFKAIILTITWAAASVTTFAQTRQQWIDSYLSVSYPLSKMHVTSPFGTRADPFSGKSSRHQGIDLRAHFEEVYAMMPGEVIKVGFEKKGGTYVTLRHGAFHVTYCHLSRPLVQKGTHVMPGEVVALSGNSGSRTTGPHLHVGVKYQGKPINPVILFDYIKGTREEAIRMLSAEDVSGL